MVVRLSHSCFSAYLCAVVVGVVDENTTFFDCKMQNDLNSLPVVRYACLFPNFLFRFEYMLPRCIMAKSEIGNESYIDWPYLVHTQAGENECSL